MEIKSYQVGQYRNGLFDSIISGMGKNRGTWDAEHSRSAAYRHAKALNAEVWRRQSGLTYRVIRTNID